MKTRAQFLLIGLLSMLPPFPRESEARLFAARLIGVEEQASPQVQLSDSEDSNFSAGKEDALRSFNRGVNIISNGRAMASTGCRLLPTP